MKFHWKVLIGYVVINARGITLNMIPEITSIDRATVTAQDQVTRGITNAVTGFLIGGLSTFLVLAHYKGQAVISALRKVVHRVTLVTMHSGQFRNPV